MDSYIILTPNIALHKSHENGKNLWGVYPMILLSSRLMQVFLQHQMNKSLQYISGVNVLWNKIVFILGRKHTNTLWW